MVTLIIFGVLRLALLSLRSSRAALRMTDKEEIAISWHKSTPAIAKAALAGDPGHAHASTIPLIEHPR